MSDRKKVYKHNYSSANFPVEADGRTVISK